MLAELALAAMLSGADSSAMVVTAPGAVHDTVYVHDSPAPSPVGPGSISARQKFGHQVAPTVLGLALAGGGSALFIHGLDKRGYNIGLSSSGGLVVTRKTFDDEMLGGMAMMLAGIAVIATER